MIANLMQYSSLLTESYYRIRGFSCFVHSVYIKACVIVEIKVVPQAGRQKWALDRSGKIKCYLLSAPEKGLANHELVGLLAKALKLPQLSIMIVAGHTNRNKRLDIKAPITREQLLEALGLAAQLTMSDT